MYSSEQLPGRRKVFIVTFYYCHYIHLQSKRIIELINLKSMERSKHKPTDIS